MRTANKRRAAVTRRNAAQRLLMNGETAGVSHTNRIVSVCNGGSENIELLVAAFWVLTRDSLHIMGRRYGNFAFCERLAAFTFAILAFKEI